MDKKPFVIDLKNDSEYQPLLNGDPHTCGMRSGRVYLFKGQDCGEHTTGAHEEILVFLDGKGRSLIGPEKEPLEVGVGKVIYIPPETLHNIENPYDEPLVYIYCVAPIPANANPKH